MHVVATQTCPAIDVQCDATYKYGFSIHSAIVFLNCIACECIIYESSERFQYPRAVNFIHCISLLRYNLTNTEKTTSCEGMRFIEQNMLFYKQEG